MTHTATKVEGPVLTVNYHEITLPPDELDVIEAITHLERELAQVLEVPIVRDLDPTSAEVVAVLEDAGPRIPVELVSTEQLERAEHAALAARGIYTAHLPRGLLFLRLSDGRLVVAGWLRDPTELGSGPNVTSCIQRERVAIVELAAFDEFRVLGWLASIAHRDIDDGHLPRIHEVPEDLRGLGCTEHGWCFDTLLRSLYLAMSPESRAVIEGPALMFTKPMYMKLTGEMVSL